MQCPNCREIDSLVLDSRFMVSENAINRRRSCKRCGHRWSTKEIAIADISSRILEPREIAKIKEAVTQFVEIIEGKNRGRGEIDRVEQS